MHVRLHLCFLPVLMVVSAALGMKSDGFAVRSNAENPVSGKISVQELVAGTSGIAPEMVRERSDLRANDTRIGSGHAVSGPGSGIKASGADSRVRSADAAARQTTFVATELTYALGQVIALRAHDGTGTGSGEQTERDKGFRDDAAHSLAETFGF